MTKAVYALLFSLLLIFQAQAATMPTDPMKSVQWPTMYQLYFKDSKVVFDDKVKVIAPDEVEDSLDVPVMVDASALSGVEEIIVFADFNPLPLVLNFYPELATPKLGFRVKLQQATPIRAAARTADGVWHVGHHWVEAAGGGCTVASVASGSPEWETKLGEFSSKVWHRTPLQSRLRFKLIHPMDTGLADGIPEFYAETLNIKDEQGNLLARIEPLQPVSENPIFTLDVPGTGKLEISGRDNNGNTFSAAVAQ